MYAPTRTLFMDISEKLGEVRDKHFEGSQKLMWKAWDINPSTLNRWLNRERVPGPDWYEFLSARLGVSLIEVHEMCIAAQSKRIRKSVRATVT